MPEIRENNGVVTQITTVKVPSDNQSEVLELMKERARFMEGARSYWLSGSGELIRHRSGFVTRLARASGSVVSAVLRRGRRRGRRVRPRGPDGGRG